MTVRSWEFVGAEDLDQSVDGYTGHTGLPLSPRGKFLEQMAASVGRVECQLTVNDLLSKGPPCYSLSL